MTVRPDADGDVTITLPEGRACGVVRGDLHQGREPAAVDQQPIGDGQGSGGELRGGRTRLARPGRAPLLRGWPRETA